jgi:uncharacterized membrane protein YgcG
MQPGAGPRGKVRSWKDVQLIISSIAVALSLGLWSTWASRAKPDEVVEAATPLPEIPTPTPAPIMLLPGQILYLSTASPQSNAPLANQEQPRRRKGGDGEGGGGGGGGGGGAADAGTGSS